MKTAESRVQNADAGPRSAVLQPALFRLLRSWIAERFSPNDAGLLNDFVVQLRTALFLRSRRGNEADVCPHCALRLLTSAATFNCIAPN